MESRTARWHVMHWHEVINKLMLGEGTFGFVIPPHTVLP